MVLFDTHVWLWTVNGDARRVGRRTRQLISRAESRQAVRVSPATLFELTALHTLGRIHLTRLPQQWIRESLDTGGIRIAELSPAIAVEAGSIPRAALAEHLDRLLVATARHLEATFFTSDTRILEYASKAVGLRVHDARL